MATRVPVPDRPATVRPVRLTRRGRAVAGAVMVICMMTASALLWLALGGPAQASSGTDRQPGSGMVRVTVEPGQTLWSIATSADPAADPRVVIPQIVGNNRLNGTTIYAGEVLWVPRG